MFGAGRVLAEASTPAKRELALGLGADAVAEYPLAERADVILDATGGLLFDRALESLADFGRLVTYGNASRATLAPVDPGRLSRLNAAVVGFWLRPTLALPGAVSGPLKDMLRLVSEGRLTPVTSEPYALSDARGAHEALRARRTTGKTFLVP